MNANRACILLAAVIALPACEKSPIQAKNRFIREFTEFIHEVERQSTHFTVDSDWYIYDSKRDDYKQLEYLEHVEVMSSVERQQVNALLTRYNRAKGRYLARRFNEKLDSFSATVKAFLSTS